MKTALSGMCVLALAALTAGSPARAQDFGANDGATGSADSIGRADVGTFGAADEGVGAAAREDHAGVDGEPFDEDTAAVNRTFNESANTNANLGSAQGTVQESAAILGDIID